MSSRRPLLWAATAVLLVASAGIWSCSKSSSPTAPPGGGGGPELDSGDFGQGQAYTHRFTTAGSFPYHCIHHAPMTGSVTVTPSSTDTLVIVSITSSTSPFPPATVRPGGTVVWTNDTPMVHTVTSD